MTDSSEKTQHTSNLSDVLRKEADSMESFGGHRVPVEWVAARNREAADRIVFLEGEVERLMHHVRGSPSLSNAYVQLAESEIAAQRKACEALREAARNKATGNETIPRHPFGNGTRVSLLRAIHTLRMPHVSCLGDAAQLEELLTWLGPDTREPPAKKAKPVGQTKCPKCGTWGINDDCGCSTKGK